MSLSVEVRKFAELKALKKMQIRQDFVQISEKFSGLMFMECSA